MKCQNMGEDTQEMLQSQNTAFPGNLKLER